MVSGNRSRNRQRLRELLRELFQFDVSNLDFGIYRILNQRREEIDRFIERDLLEAVDEELEALAEADRAEIEERLEEKREQLGEEAFEAGGSLREGALATKPGREYRELEEELEAVSVAEETEARIFNDLYRFFSRYYREGDFLTERRYSSREPKYAVPYNGEEVLLHWANRDQYYVKTTERFTDYRFRVSDQPVTFRLASAQTAQDDVQEETRHFTLVDGEPLRLDEDSGGLEIRFTYRVLGEEDKQEVLDRYNADCSKSDRRKQFDRSIVVDVLKERIFEQLEERGASDLQAELAKPVNEETGRSRLEEHLDRYTARHEMDYFVHKDLDGFLRRELDFFLKNEVLELDDLAGDGGADALRRAQLRIQVIRRIADRVIEFLAQIEDFQKRLFEKKKFVVDTQYCVTLDQVPEALYEEILANEKQLEAWQKLYAIDQWSKELEPPTEAIDRQFLEAHPYLMIDTSHFGQDFTDQLLASFEDLDGATDGLLIHGENFQALNLLQEKYQESVDCIYIDPPYNTESNAILYKNNYKHSSWLSMMHDRLLLGNVLSQDETVQVIAIDEHEQERLGLLLETIHSDREMTCVTIIHNPGGTQGGNFKRSNEYAYFIYPDESGTIGLKERADEEDWDVRPLRDVSKGDHLREDAQNCFYPIFISGKKVVGFGEVCDDDFHPGSANIEREDGVIEIYPIDASGNERKWTFARNTVEEIKDQLSVEYNSKRDIYDIIRTKKRFKPKTTWTHKKYNSNTHGSKLLNNIIGESIFDFPKSIYNVIDCVSVATREEPESLVLDYFAGSGTTGHAIISMNRDSDVSGKGRKFILTEMGEHFDTVMLPRLMKVVFCDKWRGGVPQDRNGLSQMFKYQRLESYEDTLNNLELTHPGDEQLNLYDEFDDYLLRYMLEVETRESPSLLSEDTFERPFEYKLEIQQGLESPEPKTVDLVETFHYLLGMEVESRRVEEHQDRRYVLTSGRREVEGGYETVLTIWRDRGDLDLEGEAEWIEKLFDGGRPDRIYANGPSHIGGAQPVEIVFHQAMMGGPTHGA